MTTAPGPRLLMAGMSNLDHVWQVERFPPVASRTEATAYRMQGGGPAATAAAAAARLGGQVRLCSVHGDDLAGAFAREELEGYGVDCTLLRAAPSTATPVSGVLVTPVGERFIFPFRDAPRLDRPESVDPSCLTGVDCLLTDVRYPRMSGVLLGEAQRRGIPVVGDFGNARHWELARFVDHLLVSEECADEVSGGKPAEHALADLRQFEGQVVGITLGERGVVYDRGGKVGYIPAFPVRVVDTTGAGDVFHGAYAYAVARAWDVERCGTFAAAAAALSCQGLGRSGLPTLAAVESLVESRVGNSTESKARSAPGRLAD